MHMRKRDYKIKEESQDMTLAESLKIHSLIFILNPIEESEFFFLSFTACVGNVLDEK